MQKQDILTLYRPAGARQQPLNPAQQNDIVALQKKAGDKIAFIGCWDFQAKWIQPGTVPTEEELRQRIRNTIDAYGPGGNVAIMGMIAHPAVDMFSSMMILNDEVIKYGTGYYCR